MLSFKIIYDYHLFLKKLKLNVAITKFDQNILRKDKEDGNIIYSSQSYLTL